ncbi:MAG: alpha/beta hydrolase [Actinomycetia bacterium]|nr:alpha/beta hydrolase [Actinomycetes bacterium]
MTFPVKCGPVALLVALSLIAGACSSDSSGEAQSEPDPSSSSTNGAPADSGTTDTGPDDGDGGASSTAKVQSPSELSDWEPCGDLECATLTVPLVHGSDDGRTIDLALNRYPSTGSPGRRLGSVLFNPGGPGGSGIEFLESAVLLAPSDLTDSFDLVSWDPRGVGQSEGIDCNPDPLDDALYIPDLDDDSADEIQVLSADTEEAAAFCRDLYGDLLDHVGTNDTVRDLDLIRSALGDDQLTYVGFSYGTLIGQGYLAMFPDRVRAIVLDGVVPREFSAADEELTLRRFEEVLEQRVAATCRGSSRCALGDDLVEVFDQLLADGRAARAEGREPEVEPAHLVRAAELASAVGFAHLLFAQAVDDARNGDTALLESLWGFAVDVDDNGTPRLFNSAFEAIWCGSSDTAETFDELVDHQERMTRIAPRFSLTAGLPLVCEQWRIEGESVPPIEGPIPPVLVVGTRWDPSTPWEFADRVANELDGAVLLTYEGDGHTAFLQGNRCVDPAVTDYLVHLRMPEQTTC